LKLNQQKHLAIAVEVTFAMCFFRPQSIKMMAFGVCCLNSFGINKQKHQKAPEKESTA
jgi:hypothetical protein